MPSDCGFSSTGFISVTGATPQARACKACARPISPPSAVTAALFDMFCGLKGRTSRPRLANARAKPATISDLPTSEPVPWNISARAAKSKLQSELDAGLRLHAGGKMMLHQRHLGDEVGGGDQLGLGVAAGDDHVQTAAAGAQRSDDRGEIEIFVAQRDVELVEDHETECRIAHELERLRPGALGRRDVALEVLRFPGETLPHREPRDLLAERGERVALGGMPRPLDELHDADP